MTREQFPLPEDLRVFLTVLRKGSFAAAAEELAQSPAYISKRIQILEKTLKTKLMHRTTRKLVLTEGGKSAQRWALQVLDDLDEFANELSDARDTPRGLLHISGTLGFGRTHVAPAVSLLCKKYPNLEVRLELLDRAVDIVREGYDIEIRVGDDVPEQHICKKLVDNQRIFCASPEYLSKAGEPLTLDDLRHHQCLAIKERASPVGIWHVSDGEGGNHTLRVEGPLSSNSGEIVLQWALDGHGVMLRSLWNVKAHLEQGRLVQVLQDYTQSANIWGVYPTRPSHSAKLRVCMEFLEQHFKALF